MNWKSTAKAIAYSLNLPFIGVLMSSNVGRTPPEPPTQPYNAICWVWIGGGVIALLLIRAFFNVNVGSEE
jgi:hypothetical protein